MPEFFSSNAILHSNHIPFYFTVYHENKKLIVIAAEKSVWVKYRLDLNFQLHGSKTVPSQCPKQGFRSPTKGRGWGETSASIKHVPWIPEDGKGKGLFPSNSLNPGNIWLHITKRHNGFYLFLYLLFSYKSNWWSQQCLYFWKLEHIPEWLNQAILKRQMQL